MFRNKVINAIEAHTNLDRTKIDSLIEIPPTLDLGNFAFPCFILAKELKKAPNQVAIELITKIKLPKEIVEIKANGPYINFYVNKEMFAEYVNKKTPEIEMAEKVINLNNDDSSNQIPKTVLLEFPSPNSNKPLHLGHVRNMVYGQSIKNLYAFCGAETTNVNLFNNRGIHVCKSMLGYTKWGNLQTPESTKKKSDKFVAEFYVLFEKHIKENPELEKEAQEMLQKWEHEDSNILALGKKMNKWAEDGHKKTYKKFELDFEKTYYEQEDGLYKHGKEVVQEGLSKGLFYKDEESSNVMVDLEKYGLGKKVLLRADGTSIYITQDMFLAEIKDRQYKTEKSIIITAIEQNNHFKQLFKIFELLNKPYAKGMVHLSYGMVNLPEGRMKSREGTVVDADDLIDELQEMAKAEILVRNPDIDMKELEDRSFKIAMSALRFFLLKVDPKLDIVYDPKQSVSFEGETGPYIQYTIARINSILEKAPELDFENVDYSLLTDNLEQQMFNLINQFNDIILEATLRHKPSAICRFALDLAQLFNEFYHQKQIVKEESKIRNARLVLAWKVKDMLILALELLHIHPLERM